MVGETVTVVRPTGAVPFGETRPTGTVEFPVDGCLFAPTGGYESTAGKDMTVTQPTLFAPAGADIVPTDSVRIRGLMYAVDGVPGEWRSPFTDSVVGVQVPLRRAVG